MLSHASAPPDLPLGYPPRRFLLELAAWIKREPEGWAAFASVEQAKDCLERFPFLVPEIEPSREDPDAYAFRWPDKALWELRPKERVSSRFFELKPIYDAVVPELSADFSEDCKVSLGVFWTPVERPHAVCVAICKRKDGYIGIVHLETR